ncbi:MAG: ribonuclease P protein component [Aerococcus sp.]|nr:ribonuclease P protein component [Aerococcus sp.]
MRKSYRVKSEKAFGRVFNEGKSKANRQFVVYALGKEQPHFRVGISVGKRIGNAVTRNQVKRRIRQAIFELKPEIRPNLDFIVIARKPTATMDQASVKHSLIHVLTKAHVLTENPPTPIKSDSRSEHRE